MSGEELERAERLQKYLLLRGGALVLKVALWQAAHCNEGVAAGRESAVRAEEPGTGLHAWGCPTPVVLRWRGGLPVVSMSESEGPSLLHCHVDMSMYRAKDAP